jgi:hypothetical protein
MVAPIEGLQVLTKRCIGCEEDYAARLYSYGLRGVVQVQYIHGIHVSRVFGDFWQRPRQAEVATLHFWCCSSSTES